MSTINGVGTTLYGYAKKQRLNGVERVWAETTGYCPYTYQVIQWFVLFGFPVFPLGTYRVLRMKTSLWASSVRYHMAPAPWDWFQVLRHYLIGYSILIGGLWGFFRLIS